MKSEEQISEEHAEWFARVSKFIYKEAFKHGFGHGKEVKNETRNYK